MGRPAQKKALAVEYASEFAYPEHLAGQQQHTHMFLQILHGCLELSGMSPHTATVNWAGGKGSLYHKWSDVGMTHQAPTPTTSTGGSYAHLCTCRSKSHSVTPSVKALTTVLHKFSVGQQHLLVSFVNLNFLFCVLHCWPLQMPYMPYSYMAIVDCCLQSHFVVLLSGLLWGLSSVKFSQFGKIHHL